MILGKLAIDINHRNKGLGIVLFKDAVRRTMQAADIAGIKAILIHALSGGCKKILYRQMWLHGFCDRSFAPQGFPLMMYKSICYTPSKLLFYLESAKD
ncbi:MULTISPECIES: hypothetical protein [Aerosakkonema]|uniref:hypothetical protein n=1 Tax=Aerosakkonema TaxID=1246629 RepID=UPI0035BA292C